MRETLVDWNACLVRLPFTRALWVLAFAVVLVVGTLSSARADAVLPESAKTKIMEALGDYFDGAEIVPGWRLGNVQVEARAIKIELKSAKTQWTLRLTARTEEMNEGVDTPSFKVHPPQDNVAPLLREAVLKVAARIRNTDKGGYFRPVKTPPSKAEVNSQGAWLGDTGLSLLIYLLLVCVLFLMWRGRQSIAVSAESAWLQALMIAACLWALAWVLRLSMSPMTFLHENAHGYNYYEMFLGQTGIRQPLGGQVALYRPIFALIVPTLWTVTALTAAIASLQAPLAAGIVRQLGGSKAGAIVAGVAVATLPVLIRMTGSEDALPVASTFLMLGVWSIAIAARSEDVRWLVAGLLAVALAGYVRPIMHVMVVPLGLGVLLLSPRGTRLSWLRRPGTYVAVGLYALAIANDVLAVFNHDASAMTAGWWSGTSLRSWPIVDPEVMPVWFLPLGLMGAAAAWRRSAWRPGIMWLGLVLVILSFFYTSDNGWPAALRYLVAYVWIFPIFMGLGVDDVPGVSTLGRGHWVAGCVLLCCVTAPLTHADWITDRFAPQRETDFQVDKVLPYMEGKEPATVVTVWPDDGAIMGTSFTGPLRLQGHTIWAPSMFQRSVGRAGGTIYWYRGLACWTRRNSRDPSQTGLRPTCAKLERKGRWEPVIEKRLSPRSDADWLQIGDGKTPVTIGLYRWVRPLK